MRRSRENSLRSTGGDLDSAAVGAAVADPARCRLLLSLGDGRALPASRLAADADITPATASNHLAKLTSAGLLTVRTHGRYRYYQLAGPQVADLIEALEALAPAVPVRSLRQSSRARNLREARMCYDHLAGQVAVRIMRVMIDDKRLETTDGGETYVLTSDGHGFLREIGVGDDVLRRGVRHHTDTTEHQPHLAGAIGRGLLERLSELDWLHRSPHSRAVLITPRGRQGLQRTFGVPATGIAA